MLFTMGAIPINLKSKLNLDKQNFLFPDLKIGIIIPAYNEAKTIGKTLEKIPNNISNKMEIIVIDDGSQDNTAEIASNYSITLIKFSKNRGNGAAVNAGLLYCKRQNFDVVVTLDADGQHNPKDIPKFIYEIINNKIDFVVGNRFDLGYNMPLKRKIFSLAMSIFYSILFKQRITDPTNGFRAFSKRVIQNLELETSYSTIHEVLFKVAPNYCFKEISIKVFERKHGQSFIKLNRYFERTMIALIKYFFIPRLSIKFWKDIKNVRKKNIQ